MDQAAMARAIYSLGGRGEQGERNERSSARDESAATAWQKGTGLQEHTLGNGSWAPILEAQFSMWRVEAHDNSLLLSG